MTQHDTDMTGSVMADQHDAHRPLGPAARPGEDADRAHRLPIPVGGATHSTRRSPGKGDDSASNAATGPWTLDGQDPARHALMRQVVPRPAMFVIHNVFGPRCRSTSARLWGGTRAAAVPSLDQQLKEVTP